MAHFLLQLILELTMRTDVLFVQKTVAIWGVFFITLSSFAQEAEVSAKSNAKPQIEVLSTLSIEELSQVKITSIATGTGTDKLISEAPAIAAVITADEIQRMGATTLEEALESIPGMHISNTAPTSSTKYLIRGISTPFNPQVLVLINGVPISGIIRGDRNTRLGVLPIKMISRIEVIRGPGSARYGADALAGLINVITKSSKDIEGTELGGHIGSFHTSEAWYLHGKQYEDLKLSMMLDYRETAGHKREITQDAQTRLDGIFGTNASLAPGPANLSERAVAGILDVERNKWHLQASHYTKFDIGAGFGGTGALDPSTGKATRTRTLLDLTYHDPKVSENWDMTSQAAFFHGTQEYKNYLVLFPPGANLGNGVFTDGVLGRPEYFERHVRLDSSGIYSGFENHRVQIGAGFNLQELYKSQDSTNFTANFTPRPGSTNLSGSPDINLTERGRHSFNVFVQDEWRMASDLEFTGGVRLDQYSDFGNTVNPRAVLVWATSPKLTTKLLYGRAFRAPAFAELYTINNPISIGNPEIKPETIEVYELGWTYKATRDWESSFNIFHYDLKDLITFVRNAGNSATAQNNRGQTGNGFELETTVKATRTLFLTVNYAFVDSKDKATKKPTGLYPNDKVYARGDWNFAENWFLNTQVIWLGPRHREPTDVRGSLRGYTTVDFILRRALLFKKYTVTASVKNAFDEDVKEPSPGPGPTSSVPTIPNDVPQAGRSAFVELSYKF